MLPAVCATLAVCGAMANAHAPASQKAFTLHSSRDAHREASPDMRRNSERYSFAARKRGRGIAHLAFNRRFWCDESQDVAMGSKRPHTCFDEFSELKPTGAVSG